MIRIAIANEFGDITSIFTPMNNETYTLGVQPNGDMYIELPYEISPGPWLEEHAYDWTNQVVIDRGKRPGPFYEWKNGVWEFQSATYLEKAETQRKIKRNKAKLEDAEGLLQNRKDLYLRELKNLDLTQWDNLDAIEWPTEIIYER